METCGRRCHVQEPHRGPLRGRGDARASLCLVRAGAHPAPCGCQDPSAPRPRASGPERYLRGRHLQTLRHRCSVGRGDRRVTGRAVPRLHVGRTCARPQSLVGSADSAHAGGTRWGRHRPEWGVSGKRTSSPGGAKTPDGDPRRPNRASALELNWGGHWQPTRHKINFLMRQKSQKKRKRTQINFREDAKRNLVTTGQCAPSCPWDWRPDAQVPASVRAAVCV